jgi:soluble lytic murein transglycosylase-like protein
VNALARMSLIESFGGRGPGGVVGTPPRPRGETAASVIGSGTGAGASDFSAAMSSAPTSLAPASLVPASLAPTSRSVNVPVEWSTGAGTDAVPAGTPYADLFNEAGARHGISPRLLAAVAQVESSYNPNAVSPAGAQGLMQFMPETAEGMDVNPWDPASAVDGSARLLTGLQQRFGSIEVALAAYNVGSGTVSRAGGIVPTSAQGYVDKVMSRYRGTGAVA